MKYTFVLRDNETSLTVANLIKGRISKEYVEDSNNPEIVIAVGGDGTLLQAYHMYPNAILFGVHTGHLGFFSNYDSDELDTLVDSINNNSYKVDELDILDCEFEDLNGKKYHDFAINEVTLVSPLRTLRLDVSVDNDYLERFRGTGFCISTPYGSTAYNKSLHGSVIDTTLKVMQLTEIAGINSNAYRTLQSPLILSSKRVLHFNAVNDNEVFVTLDHLSYDIKDFKSLTVVYKESSLKLASSDEKSFISRIQRTFLISQE